MLDAGPVDFDFRGASGTGTRFSQPLPAAREAARRGVWGRGTPVRISRQKRSSRVWRGPKIACEPACMTTAREETNEMDAMLQRERGGLADFLRASSRMGDVLDSGPW
jgi:hypothetical protein